MTVEWCAGTVGVARREVVEDWGRAVSGEEETVGVVPTEMASFVVTFVYPDL